ncbi:MAG: hypothetical protein HXS44_11530 [Theionarchaea archaeon]|nr:hypothetical protein [Theionarchaea archaeon]
MRSVPRYVSCEAGLSTFLVESNGDVYPYINLVRRSNREIAHVHLGGVNE